VIANTMKYSTNHGTDFLGLKNKRAPSGPIAAHTSTTPESNIPPIDHWIAAVKIIMEVV
jgi:hypothetical protein